jgi:DNA-directed RNA polymerase specialized sigma24 family protein
MTNQSALESRLEAITTQQSLMVRAHQGSVTSVGPARNALVLRYRRAIRSYLGALLKNDQDADEVAQTVLVKMLQGGFASATPDRGRFRDYLKVAVRNAGMTHLRGRQRGLVKDLADEGWASDADATWDADWRREVLDKAWEALRAHEQRQPGNLSHTLLRMLAEFPEDDSEQLAVKVSELIGRSIRADAVRKQISRARRKFAILLVTEVQQTLDEPTPARLAEELAETGLLEYVRDYLPSNWAEFEDLVDA